MIRHRHGLRGRRRPIAAENREMFEGACLCGAVCFRIDGPITDGIYCHCSRCRRAQGSAFAANGVVARADFTLVRGHDELTAYVSSPGKRRHFCAVCGSPVYSERDGEPDRLRIRLGLIVRGSPEPPAAHIFVGSGASWYEITDTLPRYEGFEPGRAGPGPAGSRRAADDQADA